MARDERRRKKGTWTTEASGPGFEGASDSLIDRHRPNLALDPGRRSGWKWVALVFVVLVAGASVALWYWGDEVAAWLDDPGGTTTGDTDGEATSDTGATGDGETTSSGGTDAPGDVDTTPPTGAATGAVAGDTGDRPAHPWPVATGSGADPIAPSGGDTTATTGSTSAATSGAGSSGDPSAATGGSTGAQAGTGNSKAGSTVVNASLADLSVSRVSKTRVQSLLENIPDAAKACVENLDTTGVPFEATISISFGVKWNGRVQGLRVDGEGTPKGVDACVRDAVPKARYPQPPPGKDGRVRATVKISRK